MWTINCLIFLLFAKVNLNSTLSKQVLSNMLLHNLAFSVLMICLISCLQGSALHGKIKYRIDGWRLESELIGLPRPFSSMFCSLAMALKNVFVAVVASFCKMEVDCDIFVVVVEMTGLCQTTSCKFEAFRLFL